MHRTTYEYSAEMLDGYSVANLLARETPTQRVVSTELTTTPAVDERDDRSDVFGNQVVQLGVHHPHTQLVVEATTEVVVQPQIETRVNPPWEQAAAQTAAARGVLALDVLPFIAGSRFVPTHVQKHTDNQGVVRAELLQAFASEFSPGRPLLEVIRGVCGSIFNGYRFDQSSTTVSTPLSEVMVKRAGVCQDFAHLAVGAFRARGIAARYVSGYIETDPPPGEVKTIGADASHAWCAVWIPEHGWVDFDPTNNIIGPDRHVTVGWGRDYADVAPIRGVVIGPTSQQKLSVAVDVARLD